jgi:DNA polymerase sigma
MIAVDQTNVEHETNYLINFIAPIVRSNDTRHQIVAFIRDILHKSALLEGLIIECGSSAFKSYLPESDLDLVLLAPGSRNNREEIQCLTSIFNSWCDEIADKDEGKSSHGDMTIRNVEFVNARTKLAHCLVNNISVDVTVNQIGAILTLTFLEEADRLIGCNHLFKRSLLLIKVRTEFSLQTNSSHSRHFFSFCSDVVPA